MERLRLLMMFMEIISLEIIVGHKEQRDGDINHAIMTHKLVSYQLMNMDGSSDSVRCLPDNEQKTPNLFSPLWEAYPLFNAFLFHKSFFSSHKSLKDQRKRQAAKLTRSF